MIRTKIVCTIGPASHDLQMLRKLIAEGMDVARLNMSHATHAKHAEDIANIRQAANEIGKPVAIMADLQGPKLRIGELTDSKLEIAEGERITLTTRKLVGKRQTGGQIAAVVPVKYDHLPEDVKPGEHILIDDGLLELQVLGANGPNIFCNVLIGGELSDHKGVNLPGTNLSVASITEKDWADLDFALKQEVDWIALSFVRTGEEIIQLKSHIIQNTEGRPPARVIAKIEKPQALDNIDKIIEASDAIMVARGDMGIETAPERVPLIQKHLIRSSNVAGKPVITATQMLDSMVRNPRPTRAEASDVANAILDGTDAIMLSNETATGKYPLEAVRTMVNIAREIERETMGVHWKPQPQIETAERDVTDAVSHATCETASALRLKAIITSTSSGRTARAIARFRPQAMIIATTPHPIVQRQLILSWGVIPLLSDSQTSISRLVRNAIRLAVDAGHIEEGDQVVITAGIANSLPGKTNLMMVEMVKTGDEAVSDL